MTAGKIILLNGSSSAGKTTLARALQQKLDEPWQHIALDQFRNGMSGRYRGLNSPAGTPGHAGLNIVPAEMAFTDAAETHTEKVTHIRFGEIGRKMLKGMRRAIAAFAEAGNNVIVDDILFEPEFLEDYVDALGHLNVLLVAVRCPLSIVNQRERKRSGRFPGTATSHFHRIHENITYDIEVDTSLDSPLQCASQVIRHLREVHSFDAVKRMKRD